MDGFDMGETIYKAFLAGVGAVAAGAEKSQQLVDELVKKGEITVEQGKNLNSELTRKVKETFESTVSGASDAALRSKLESMTPEQRAAYVQKAADEPVAEDVSDASEDAVEPDAAE